MSITSQPKRSFRTFAAVVPVLAALVVPAGASASDGKARGVRAELESGTLTVQGSDRADRLALRLKAGDPSQVQVDVGGDGSADFSFARSDVRAIEVATGNGDDSARIDDSNAMDTDDVETVDFNALGAADSITVNDLTGTDVPQVNLDLAAALGGNAGDGAADSVVVNGTNGADTIHIDGTGSGADVTGLASAVSVKHADPDDSADPSDSLSVNTLAGADNVLAAGVAGVLQVLVDGNPV